MNRILAWFLIALIFAMSGPLQAATMASARGFEKSLYGRSAPWADKYAYCQGDPVNRVDPSGLIPGRDYGEMYLPKTEGAVQRREAGTRAMAPKVLKEVALLALLGGGIRIAIRGCALLRYKAALNLAGDAAELGEEVSALREGLVPAVELGRLAVVVHGSQLTAEVAEGLIAYVKMMQKAHKLRYLMMVSCGAANTPIPAQIAAATGLPVLAATGNVMAPLGITVLEKGAEWIITH